MILDTSALIAILRDEPDARRFADEIADAPTVSISAATLVEYFLVADRPRDPAARGRADDVLRRADAAVVPFTAEHAALARQAHRDFGRGSGHPARLDLGDCFAYALARATGEPLLYQGDDFARTDVRSALEGT